MGRTVDASTSTEPSPVKEWTVAGALIGHRGQVLLVQNQRRNGSVDWTTPGGVIEVADGESVLHGLTREVHEETGLRVLEWSDPVYFVSIAAPHLGWNLRVEVYRATLHEGDVEVGNDPDGIVIGAEWLSPAECLDRLEGGHRWVTEPLTHCLESWDTISVDPTPHFRYRVHGDIAPGQGRVERLL